MGPPRPAESVASNVQRVVTIIRRHSVSGEATVTYLRGLGYLCEKASTVLVVETPPAAASR